MIGLGWVSALIFHKSKVALEKKLHLIVDKKLGAVWISLNCVKNLRIEVTHFAVKRSKRKR